MPLGQRAALFAVGLVAATTTAAAVLVIDSLPEVDNDPIIAVRPAPALRGATADIETGALPRAGLYPEDGSDLRLEFEQPPQAAPGSLSRFTFVAPEERAPDASRTPEPGIASAEADAWSAETRPAASPRETAPKATATAQPPPSPSAQSSPPRTERRRVWRSKALEKRLAEISPAASRRLESRFKAANVAWPPDEVAFVAIKDKKQLELFARTADGPWTFVHDYRVLAASGGAGPKLARGDKQVPEGIYGITYLNPHSRYHVSLRVNYPNAFDRKMAKKDGRKDLGGDIMIHGKRSSAGCLAMGDEAAEELFVLAAEIGTRAIKLVIAPTDFRKSGIPADFKDGPDWLPKLYMEVASEMSQFKQPSKSGGGLLSLLGL